MRHRNPKSASYFSPRHGEKCYSPYLKPYTYTRPTPARAYVKVVKFIAEHPDCKRIDVIRGLWRPNANAFDARGFQSSLFANLLYADFIDYNSKHEYNATQKGYDLLKHAGLKTLTVIKTITL